MATESIVHVLQLKPPESSTSKDTTYKTCTLSCKKTDLNQKEVQCCIHLHNMHIQCSDWNKRNSIAKESHNTA